MLLGAEKGGTPGPEIWDLGFGFQEPGIAIRGSGFHQKGFKFESFDTTKLNTRVLSYC